MVEFDADGAIAIAVARWACHPEIEQIVICSPDKEFRPTGEWGRCPMPGQAQ